MKKILVINPNSSKEMTQAIDMTVQSYASNRFDADTVCLEGAPPFIGCCADQVRAGTFLLDMIQQKEALYDGFIVACHLDPCLDGAKETTRKPVMGIGEVSMRMAPLLGRTFSVVGSSPATTLLKRRLVEKYGLERFMASVRAPGTDWEGSQEEKLIRAAAQAVKEDGAEVIVLGCAGFSGLDRRIEAAVGVPVLDGVVCALIAMEGILQYKG